MRRRTMAWLLGAAIAGAAAAPGAIPGAAAVPAGNAPPFDGGEVGTLVHAQDGDLWLTPEGGSTGRLHCAERSACANSDAEESQPAWSPDGTRVAFTTTRNGNSDVYVAPLEGGPAVPVAKTAADESDPAWSPDGTRLAYTSDADGHLDVYWAEARAGARPERVTSSPADDFDPTWSPDGGSLAFASNRADASGTAPGQESDLFVANVDGTGVRQLTDTPADELVPDWWAAGGEIAYMSNSAEGGTAFEIYVVSVDSGKARRVTDSGGSNENPSWAGMAPEIVFQSTRPSSGGDSEIFVIEPDGSGENQLTANGNADVEGWALSSNSFTVDELDGVDDPAPCTNGTDGPRVEVDYLVPTGHTDRFATGREAELRNLIKSFDRMLNYATGPWRDQDWRWTCVNSTHVINKGTGIPAVPGGVNKTDLDTWLADNGYKDGNLHVGYIELEANECLLRDGVCSQWHFDVWRGGTNPPYDNANTWGWVYVNASHPSGASRRDFTARHEVGHVGLGAPDIYSPTRNPDYGEDDEMDVMASHVLATGAYCARTQMDCGKEEWFSSLLERTGVNPSWTGQFQNSSTSVYLTFPALTSTTPVYCVGTLIGPTKHDEAADNFQGSAASDVVSLLDQNDIADGYGGDDRLCGGDGADTLRGGSNNDTVSGSGGPDTINGGDGNDYLYDGWAFDRVDGGAGYDILYACNDSTTDESTNTFNVEEIKPAATSYCRNRNFEI